jgi:hypothetical protein
MGCNPTEDRAGKTAVGTTRPNAPTTFHALMAQSNWIYFARIFGSMVVAARHVNLLLASSGCAPN